MTWAVPGRDSHRLLGSPHPRSAWASCHTGLVEQSKQGVGTRCAAWRIPGRREGRLPPTAGQGPVTGPALLLPATERD